MIAAVCIEDRGGMCFCGRRVSRDSAQQADLLALAGERRLRMNRKSAALFPGTDVTAEEDFLEKAGPGEVCFVEDRPLRPVLDRLEQLVVYRWNRTYPSDLQLDLDPAADGFVLTEQKEFPGSSHETITREIYERRG